ncbi:MAG: hypothetical protein GX455_13770 [Phycisphaerae bacterium]|nr:hypothetical protein [Phycisphaerae bacterium]
MDRTGQRAMFRVGAGGPEFVVKGVNFVRLRRGDHSTFEAVPLESKAPEAPNGDCYDPQKAEAMLAFVQSVRLNTVRVFIIGRSAANPGIAGPEGTTTALYEPYMANVLDFLERAEKHGIYVLPTFGDGELPRNEYFRKRLGGGGNRIYLTSEGIAAKREYVREFLQFIQSRRPELMATLLGVQMQNELHLDGKSWPFDAVNGTVTSANGKTYDLSNARQRQALMDEGIVYYLDAMTDAVHKIDPKLLVCEGIFTMRAVGKNPDTDLGPGPEFAGDRRWPPTLETLSRSKLDFLDVHFYRTRTNESVADAFARDMETVRFVGATAAAILKDKPVILGEFGAFQFAESSWTAAQENLLSIRDEAMYRGMSGWLLWTYDTFEQTELMPGMTDGGELLRRLGN